MSRFANQGSRPKVLVVDDHAPARESISDVLRQAGYDVVGLASAVEALPVLETESVDVVVTDLQMPGLDGVEFIRQMSLRRVRAQAIMITAHATIASAVDAMRHGAFDYMEKPFDVAKLEQLVARALERRRLLDPELPPTGDLAGAVVDAGMIGDSPRMQELRRKIAQVAPTDETVLICGESGTGKELVARALHRASRRAAGPLVSLNCPALSPQLAESELFGHRRGAFTGADDHRTGRFELAQGGTILLDEITEIDLPLQAKLLRVLQEKTYEPVGSSESQVADVRVIATTNRDLKEAIAEGRFREDLYYRLAVLPLQTPPLRQRGDDVGQLIQHFMDRAAQRLDRPSFGLTDDAAGLLGGYHWPGNVRELENIVTRACVLSDGGEISADQIRPWLQDPMGDAEGEPQGAAALPVGSRLDVVERQMIVATLERFQGHRGRTAEALGIGVRTLSGKLRSYGYAPREKDFSGESCSDRQNTPAPAANGAAAAVDRAA